METIPCQLHPVYLTTHVSGIGDCIAHLAPDRIFVLADANTAMSCLPLLTGLPALKHSSLHVMPAGEQAKTLTTCTHIWTAMTEAGLSRNSLLIAVGGGVCTDIGGFCASVFKRGLRFMAVPTSLLAMVDAALGGKTGVDFLHYKNHLGTFHTPSAVVISTEFLLTLPEAEWQNGIAEIIKHGLISDSSLTEDLGRDSWRASPANLIRRAAAVKCSVVDSDPAETGLRKILNFGHTAGHAIESLLLQLGKPAGHGKAVAAGMQIELYLSHHFAGLSASSCNRALELIRSHFEAMAWPHDMDSKLVDIMRQDKKNKAGYISFSLLKEIGTCVPDQYIQEETRILDALAWYSAQTGVAV